MDPSLQTVLSRLDHLPEQFRDIREGVEKAVLVADLDPEMALTRARKVLELVVREVHERRCQEPPGTRPLENLLQRLVRDGYLPTRLEAYANTVRMLGNVGTHRFGERITSADVQQSLSQLLPILDWYVQEERPDAAGQQSGQVQPEAAGTRPAEPTAAARPRARVAVVPKGLRSFDARDAGFFLDLLPGPRDEHGLPESIRFWKHRIEERDELTFTVGVLYGPSGCGKSSLVKAGLLPRLAERVLSVYVEAAAEDTEARLLQGLRKRCPGLPADLDLVGTLTALRHGQVLHRGQKVLLVLDQFEQWLHARRAEPDPELVQALRQCDGERVQCLVLVRDDFGMAVTRFMAALDMPILQGQNFAAADLFDPQHARRVLAEFGRAFGRLPADLDHVGRDEEAFLKQAVAGLAQDGRVIPVRLALFAEMVKGRPWTPATLKEVGGTAGVGVAFLEETFCARTAQPLCRLHQQAARAVLKALLPEQGTDIKGNMQSHDKLLQASGYAGRPKDFEALLRILDGELRLLTPTEPPGTEATGERYYQLTHDYLVHALRKWLTRKQKETRRGRAELRLAERTALWTVKPESRHLPAWWEWANIRLLTRKKDWTPPQRKMMRQAAHFHAVRAALLTVALGALVLAGLGIRGQVLEQQRQEHVAGLVRSLLGADTARVPEIIADMEGYRPWANPLLRQANAEAADGSSQKLHTSLALLAVDPGQAEYLRDRLLQPETTPQEVLVIREALLPYREELREALWQRCADARAAPDERFRAAAALALLDPDDPRWDQAATDVAGRLVVQSTTYLGQWLDVFRPVRLRLLPALGKVFRRPDQPQQRAVATDVLADYAADQPDELADLLKDADERQWATQWPKVQPYREPVLASMQQELARQVTPNWQDTPLSPEWTAPRPELVRQVEAAQGLVAEHFALCQTLALDQLEAVAEGLRPSGYRPIRLRPYVVGDTVQVATLWARDGRDWRMALGLSAERVSQQDGEWQAQGYLPVDVAGYRADGERYAAVYEKAESKGQEGRLCVGVPDAKYQDATEPLKKDGFAPLTLQAMSLEDEAPRYSSVWRKGTLVGSTNWRLDRPSYEGAHLDQLPVDMSQVRRTGVLALLSLSPGEDWYGGVWQARADREAVKVLGLDPAQHLQRCRELAKLGYRPAAISAAEVHPGKALVTASLWHRPVIPEADRDALARRQAQAAVALLRLGQAETVWPLLRHSPDPGRRTYLLHRLGPLQADPQVLIQRLESEPDVSARRALILSLGEYTAEQLPAEQRRPVVERLLPWYRDDPDPGMHSAIDWLLRQAKEGDTPRKLDWHQAEALGRIDQELAGKPAAGDCRWYDNRHGQTLAVVPGPVEFLMGSPASEPDRIDDETLHCRRIGRSFAIATKDVTVRQFQDFLEAHREVPHNYIHKYSPDPDGPIISVTWYEAAQYCRWLSEQEGVPEEEMCYPPIADIKEGMKPVPDYLSKTGYRLPTEAEWEYACRAGSLTSRSYGAAEEILPKYAWYIQNAADRAWPVGQKPPNDLGLFDMHGNVWQWCQESGWNYEPGEGGKPAEDIEDMRDIKDNLSRVLRGASFDLHASVVRSACRTYDRPSYRNSSSGLRLARTYH